MLVMAEAGSSPFLSRFLLQVSACDASIVIDKHKFYGEKNLLASADPKVHLLKCKYQFIKLSP